MARIVPTEKFIEQNYSTNVRAGQYFDPYELIFQWGKSAIATARATRDRRARSYRNFKVGSAVISVNDEKHEAAGFVSANSKLSKEDDKICAEMNIVGEAKKQGYDYHVGLFVVGTTDPEEIKEVTGLATPTLHPCEPCRALIDEATVVISTGYDEDVYEVYTGKQLWNVYAEPEVKQKRNRRRSEQQNKLVQDPGLVQFMGADAVYSELVERYKTAPERATRMLRAEAVVDSLQQFSRPA